MNPYVIHCEPAPGGYVVRTVNAANCRIINTANYHDSISARLKAGDLSRVFAHAGTPAPIVYALGTLS